MKKKIVLMVSMLALLICVCAISVSADNIVGSDSNAYGTLSTVDGVAEPTVINKDAKTVVVVNGTYYTIPTYYLIKDNSHFTWSVNSSVATALGLPTGNDVRKYVVRMEIPEGIETSHLSGNGGAKFEDATNLLEASIPTTLRVMGEHFFGRCTALTTVKGLENSKVEGILKQAFNSTKITSISMPSTVTIIGQQAFGSTPLTSVVIPDSVESIGDHAFASCTSLASITISENSKLKMLEGQYQFEQTAISSFYFPSSLESLGTGGAFFKCGSLETLINFENTKVTDIPYRTFASGPKFTSFSFPQGIVSIGDSAFYGHMISGDIILPNTVTSLGDHAFAGANISMGKLVLSAKLDTITGTYTFEKSDFSAIYIPASITAFPQGAFKETKGSGAVYFYTGTREQLNALLAETTASDNGNFLNATIVTLDEYNAIEDTSKKNYIVYGYSCCDAFYNGAHNISTTITYESFGKTGTKVTGCTNDGCNHNTTATVPAIFECQGFASPESTVLEGISIGFLINRTALNDYTATGKELNYGLFVALAERLDGNYAFDENGQPTSGVISVDMTKYGNSAFALKVTGFNKGSENDEKYKAAKLVIGAYVIENGENGKSISYIQDTEPTDGSKYSYVSYNGIVNNAAQ